MEIKNILEKPYTENQKIDFIIENNHQQGYEIRETDVALEAWGNTDSEVLVLAKQAKYNEANSKAKEYLDSGNALFELEEGKHIEATDGNIAKMTAYALAYITGQLQPTDTVVWNTKEDETVELNQEQIGLILAGLGQVQALVWAVKFPAYVQAIEQAETVEEVNGIVIDYTQELPAEEEASEADRAEGEDNSPSDVINEKESEE